MQSRKKPSARLTLENLESRELLAGSITAAVPAVAKPTAAIVKTVAPAVRTTTATSAASKVTAVPVQATAVVGTTIDPRLNDVTAQAVLKLVQQTRLAQGPAPELSIDLTGNSFSTEPGRLNDHLAQRDEKIKGLAAIDWGQAGQTYWDRLSDELNQLNQQVQRGVQDRLAKLGLPTNLAAGLLGDVGKAAERAFFEIATAHLQPGPNEIVGQAPGLSRNVATLPTERNGYDPRAANGTPAQQDAPKEKGFWESLVDKIVGFFTDAPNRAGDGVNYATNAVATSAGKVASGTVGNATGVLYSVGTANMNGKTIEEKADNKKDEANGILTLFKMARGNGGSMGQGSLLPNQAGPNKQNPNPFAEEKGTLTLEGQHRMDAKRNGLVNPFRPEAEGKRQAAIDKLVNGIVVMALSKVNPSPESQGQAPPQGPAQPRRNPVADPPAPVVPRTLPIKGGPKPGTDGPGTHVLSAKK